MKLGPEETVGRVLRTLSSLPLTTRLAVIRRCPSGVDADRVLLTLSPATDVISREEIRRAHEALTQLRGAGEPFVSGSFVQLVGGGQSEGVGLIFQEAGARRLARATQDGIERLPFDPERYRATPIPHVRLIPPRRPRPTDPRLAIIRDLFVKRAPVGSLFRKWLINALQQRLAMMQVSPGSGITLARFQELLGEIAVLGIYLMADPRRMTSERVTYRFFFPQYLDLLFELEEKGLRLFESEEGVTLRALKAEIEGAPALPRLASPNPVGVRAAFEDLLGGPSHDATTFSAKIRLLKRVLMEDLFGFPKARGLAGKRIAVVGYGTNLDLTAFFVDLGFSVTAIEKRTAQEAWVRGLQPPPLDSSDPFLEATGLLELASPSPTWPQFTPDEVTELLRHPPNLQVYDVSDVTLPWGSFDIVFVPAMVDEALETVVRLPRAGGFVWVETVSHPRIQKTATSEAFLHNAEADGGQFGLVYDCGFRGIERVLPTEYLGDRRVYVAVRRS